MTEDKGDQQTFDLMLEEVAMKASKPGVRVLMAESKGMSQLARLKSQNAALQERANRLEVVEKAVKKLEDGQDIVTKLAAFESFPEVSESDQVLFADTLQQLGLQTKSLIDEVLNEATGSLESLWGQLFHREKLDLAPVEASLAEQWASRLRLLEGLFDTNAKVAMKVANISLDHIRTYVQMVLWLYVEDKRDSMGPLVGERASGIWDICRQSFLLLFQMNFPLTRIVNSFCWQIFVQPYLRRNMKIWFGLVSVQFDVALTCSIVIVTSSKPETFLNSLLDLDLECKILQVIWWNKMMQWIALETPGHCLICHD